MHLSMGYLLQISLLILYKVDDEHAVLTQQIDDPPERRMIPQATDGAADFKRALKDEPAETSPITNPDATPSLPSQLLGVIYSINGVDIPFAEKGVDTYITCRCQKDRTVHLVDENDKKVFSHDCKNDLDHDFIHPVKMENFGKYWCNLNGKNSDDAFNMDYYVCDESSDICRNDAHCKVDQVYYCIVTKEHPNGKSCQTLRDDQCSYRYNMLFCPGEFTSMCAKDARTNVTTQFSSWIAAIPPVGSNLLKYDPKVFDFKCPPEDETVKYNYQNFNRIVLDGRYIHRSGQDSAFLVVCPIRPAGPFESRLVTWKKTLVTVGAVCDGPSSYYVNMNNHDTNKFFYVSWLRHANWTQRLLVTVHILRVQVQVEEFAPVKAVEEINCHVTGLSSLFTSQFTWKFNDEELTITTQKIDAKLRGSGTYKCSVKVTFPVCNPYSKYVEYFDSEELKIDIIEAQSTTTVVTTPYTGKTNEILIFETIPVPTVKPIDAKLFNLPFATGLAIILSTIATVVLALLCFSVYLMRGKGSKTVNARRFLMFRKKGVADQGKAPRPNPQPLVKGRGSTPSVSNRSVATSVVGQSKRSNASTSKLTNQTGP